MNVHINKISNILKFGKYPLSISGSLAKSKRRCGTVIASIEGCSKYNCSNYTAVGDCVKVNRNDGKVKPYQTNAVQRELISNFIRRESVPTSKDIELFKYNVINAGKYVNNKNIDSIVLSFCVAEQSIRIGRDYFKHVFQFKKSYNIAAVGNFFFLCYKCKQFCTNEDKKLIIKLYHELIEKYNILDSTSCESAVLALSLTECWKEGLKLIDMCKLTSEPSAVMYNALITASFKNNDHTLGWDIIENALNDNKSISAEALSCCIQCKLNINSLLKLFQKYNVRISRDSANVLLENHSKASSPLSIKPKITTISKTGQCANCSETLKSIELSSAEFLELKNKFLSSVLVGENIFLKTKPTEFQAFLNFTKVVGQVDVVLDGLNVAYSAGSNKGNKCSFTLLKVIDWFREKGKRVLVIGRKHMLKWPHKHIDIIKKKSFLFLTEDVSADDPYLLFATMSSGLGTIFVSRDQMRGHKFLLKEPKLRVSFSKWQQMHQYYIKAIKADGKVLLESAPSYLECVQQSSDGRWHLPLVCEAELKQGVPGHLLAQTTTWLCLP